MTDTARTATHLAATGRIREDWVDAAKGMAILLVVLTHAQTELAQVGHHLPAWAVAADTALGELRMPTFFLVSGLFAARALTDPIRSFARAKVTHFGYLYLLWSAFWLAALAGRAAASGHPVGDTLAEPAVGVLTAAGRLWYLVALPMFFIAARLMRRLPVAVQLATAAALSVVFATDLITIPAWGPDRMAQYLVWFLLGCHLSGVIRMWVPRARCWVPVVLVAAWVAGAAVLGASALAAVTLPLLAVPAAVTAAARAPRWLGRPLARLGAHTLPVYVLHSAALAIIVTALGTAVPALAAASGTAAEVAIVAALPVITAAAVALALGVWWGLRRWPWLFRLPAASKDRR